jgi:hypothetical protein
MTQPDNPVPARGARPQLFGEAKAGKSRQPDFGPSILATIDGKPRREAKQRDGVSLKRVLWMSALALGVVLVYFAVKLGMMPGPAAAPSALAMQAPAEKPVEPVVLTAVPVATASAIAATTGAASIENVAAPPAPVAALAASSVEPASANVATSLSNIQEVLAKAETKPEPLPKADRADRPVAPKAAVVAKQTVAERPVNPSSKTANRKAGPDGDTDLIAAMLPHIKDRNTSPISPTFEKRCGHLVAEAKQECRNRFCAGRAGLDAACPVGGMER